MEETSTSGINVGKLIGGLIVLAVGGMFLAEQFDLADFHSLFRWWPLILIGLGISKLGNARNRERIGSGLWLIAIGCWLLVSSLELWGLDFSNSWPLLLVIVGVSMVVRSFFPREQVREEASNGKQ